MEQPIAKKPSFFGSVMSGIAGSIKGMLAGGMVGAIAGAVIGAIVGIATGGFGLPIALAAAGDGALIGSAVLGAVGAAAGTVTGVVRHREAGQPSAADVVGVAKVTFAQGVAVGHNIAQAEQQAQVAEVSTAHRDKILKERAAQAAQPQHRVH